MPPQAKKTKTAQGAPPDSQESQEDYDARMAARTYVATEQDWTSAEGVEYGGQADILALEVGEVAGPFEYIGSQPMTLEKGNINVHIGKDPHNNSIRLPIAASFLRTIDQAGVKQGDKFLIRRGEDAIKQRGIGKGQIMAIYTIKVTHRTVPASAPF